MKNIFISIITIFYIFSTFSFVNAYTESPFEKVLDLGFWPETLEINFEKVKDFSIKNSQYSNSLNNFKSMDSILRNVFIENYRSGKYDKNIMNGIITNYNLFIYHINKYFEYIALKENNIDLTELDYMITNNFKLARNYIIKLKYILDLAEKRSWK